MKRRSKSSSKSKAVAAGDDGDSDGKTAATSKGSSSAPGMLPPILSSDMVGGGGQGPWHDVTGNPGVKQADNGTPVLSSFLRRSSNGRAAGGDSSKRRAATTTGGGAGATGDTANRHFEGFARVFFQGRSDKTARQLLPSELNDTVTSDSYLYVTVDPDESTLVLYPYKVDNDDDGGDQEDCRPLIDPPIDLVDFNAEPLDNSVCGAALYVRREAEDDPDARRRHVFRFEFRNDCVLQSRERVQQLQFASKKAIQVTRKEGKNMQKAAVNFFSSHDDVEVARQLAEQKLQDSYSHYLSEVRAMQHEASSLARKFVRIVNDVSASAVAAAAAAKAASAPSVVSSVVPQQQQQQSRTTKPFGGRKKKPTRRARADGDVSEEGTYASASVVEDTDTSDGPSHDS